MERECREPRAQRGFEKLLLHDDAGDAVAASYCFVFLDIAKMLCCGGCGGMGG
jgi:hypothetical protein